MSTPALDINTVANTAAVAHVIALRIYCGRLETLQASLEPADGSVPPKSVLDDGVKVLALKEKAMYLTPQVRQRIGEGLLADLATVETDVRVQWKAALACVGRMLVKLAR